jgi:hypothetical protein
MSGKVVVYLSNGEVFTSDDRELQFVSRRMAVINGKKYLFAPFSRHPDDSPNNRLKSPASFGL